MKYSFQAIITSVLLCFSSAYATTHTVTIPNGNNPWSPTAGSLAECIVAAQNTGDTIVFDYTILGNSPTITLEAAFTNFPFGGFTIDGLIGLPGASALPRIITNGSPGVNASAIVIGTHNNTTLRGLDFGPVAGHGIFITSSNNTIDSCYIRDCNYHGINISATGASNTIINSLVYGNNKSTVGLNDPEHAGIYSLGSGTVVDSSYIYGNGANGIMIKGGSSQNGIVRNSVIGRDNQGNETGNEWNGIFLWNSANGLVENNVIVNNGTNPNNPAQISGIRFQELTSGTIDQNFIGTDAVKTSAGNTFDGITLNTNVSNVNITNNVVCNNGFLMPFYGTGGGIALRVNTQNITIASNFVGIHADLTDGGNNDYGISVETGSSNNTIGGTNIGDGNTIGFSKNSGAVGAARGCGIWIVSTGTTNNEVYNNNIVSNVGAGVEISTEAQNNIIGANNQPNTIGLNNYGILVHGANTSQNTLRYNSFSCNTIQGISLQNGGNNDYGNGAASYVKEVLVNSSEIRTNFISGLAPSASATIDIYVADNVCAKACDDDANQGMTMVATVTASSTPNSNGLYFWEYDFVAGGNLVTKNNAIVLATENGIAGQTNTSEFSVCANLCNVPVNSAINSADLDLCIGESTVLTANSNGKDATEGYSYNWYLDGISPSNKVSYAIDDSTLTVTQGGVYTVVISSQLDSASCSDTTTTATVVVNQLPTINITSPTTAICDGDSVILNAGTSGANLSILWTPGNETTNAITVKTDDTYKVVVTNTVTTCVDSATTTITKSAVPVLALSAPFFCQGESTTVDAGVSGMTYAWSPSGNTTQSFTVTSELMHTVTVTDPSNNCSATDSILADQSADPNPTVSLPVDSFMCLLQGQTIDITATVVTSSNGTLTWSNGTTDDLTITATDTIEYIATYSDTNQCTGADTMKISNLCTPPDPTLPNIVTTELPWIPFGEITPEQVIKSDFVVYNRWGLKMYSSEEILPKWNGFNERDQKCSAGVYFWIWEYTDVTNKTYKYNGFLQLVH